MRLLAFRVGLIGAMTAVAFVGWSVGGTTGVFIWMGGLLGLWGATRIANQLMSGFILGDAEGEAGAYDPDADHEDVGWAAGSDDQPSERPPGERDA